MSALKTATSALTAVALVSGIGFAWAQADEQPVQPADIPAAAMPSEETPADPNALPPVDNTMADRMQPQQQADDPARVTPPADSTTTALPQDSHSQPAAPLPATSAEPAPRADRN
jgi:hypothetical protein